MIKKSELFVKAQPTAGMPRNLFRWWSGWGFLSREKKSLNINVVKVLA